MIYLNVMRQNELKNFEGKNGAITNKNAQKKLEFKFAYLNTTSFRDLS